MIIRTMIRNPRARQWYSWLICFANADANIQQLPRLRRLTIAGVSVMNSLCSTSLSWLDLSYEACDESSIRSICANYMKDLPCKSLPWNCSSKETRWGSTTSRLSKKSWGLSGNHKHLCSCLNCWISKSVRHLFSSSIIWRLKSQCSQNKKNCALDIRSTLCG